jgi:ubiquinone/menaquinone biosynthesis C-methylase UbiE
MRATDVQFTGSIPDVYGSTLVPLVFEPYARDLVARLTGLGPTPDVLETAAGTGAVTRVLAEAFPGARIVATDLNPAMLAVAARTLPRSVTIQAADAQNLPFEPASFDAVVCQFGVMFFPDKVGALREARRVLRPGGTFVFNVWDRLEANPVSHAVDVAVAAALPPDPRAAGSGTFMERVPFGWHDPSIVHRALESAGFADVAIAPVAHTTTTAAAAAAGLCGGTPLRAEIEARAPGKLAEVTALAERALRERFGEGTIENAMRALVFVARA